MTMPGKKSKCKKSDALKLTLKSGKSVPIAVSGESEERSFAAMVRGANAVLQIAGCPFIDPACTIAAASDIRGLGPG